MPTEPIYKDILNYYTPDYYGDDIQTFIKDFYERNNISIDEYPELASKITHFIFICTDALKIMNVDCMGKVFYHKYETEQDSGMIITDCFLLNVFSKNFILPWTYDGLLR